MKWLKRLGLVILVLVVLFVGVGLFLPTTYHVSSTVRIDAPRQTVHALVADLEQWSQWEPWTEIDDSVVVHPGEKTQGVGASQTWTDKTGGGELTFTQSDLDSGVHYDVIFGKKYHCAAGLTYQDTAQGVEVTWHMSGDTETPVFGGYFAKLLPMMIQPMFDRGLENLKVVAEP